LFLGFVSGGSSCPYIYPPKKTNPQKSTKNKHFCLSSRNLADERVQVAADKKIPFSRNPTF